MFIHQRVEGRLLECRLGSPVTLDEIERSIQVARMTVLSLPGKVVCCTDVSRLDLLPSDAVAPVMAMFTRDNPRIERSGFLVAKRLSPMGMQMERLIREARSPARQSFDDATLLERYLAEVLTVAERARLKIFLADCQRA